MKTPLITSKTLGFTIALSLSSFGAHAVNLSVGANEALPGTTSSAEPQLAGTVLVDENIPFSLNGITGHVQQRVVRSSVDGSIDFYWRVFNDASSKASVGSLRVGEFLAPEYNVNWRIDGLGDLQPDHARRLNWGSINFLFSDGLPPGKESKFFFFDTTAKEYAKNAFFDLTGTGSGNITQSYAAYTPVFKTTHETPQECPVAKYNDGNLNIPVVKVSDPFGGSISYDVDMKLTNQSPLTFEVTKATPNP